MNNSIKLFLISIFLIVANFHSVAQARLKIENNSMRSMTVKVMKDNGSLHKLIEISAYDSQTIFFSETGYYFIKTKAILANKEPVYRKGDPFRVYNGIDGYSVLTITFTITESNIVQTSGGKQISKKEFEQD